MNVKELYLNTLTRQMFLDSDWAGWHQWILELGFVGILSSFPLQYRIDNYEYNLYVDSWKAIVVRYQIIRYCDGFSGKLSQKQ